MFQIHAKLTSDRPTPFRALTALRLIVNKMVRREFPVSLLKGSTDPFLALADSFF